MLEEQLAAHDDLASQLERFYAEMEQTAAALDTINAQIVRMGLAEAAGAEQELTGQVRELRQAVDALCAAIEEPHAGSDAGSGSDAARGSDTGPRSDAGS